MQRRPSCTFGWPVSRTVSSLRRRLARAATQSVRNRCPRRPARSWMYCQATRPERAPRVVDHSSASARRVIGSIFRPKWRVAADHGEILILAAVVEAEPEPEPVRQRDLLLDRLRRVDRGRALVLHHVARHQVAPVRRRIEDDVLRAALRCRRRAPPSATCSWCRHDRRTDRRRRR